VLPAAEKITLVLEGIGDDRDIPTAVAAEYFRNSRRLTASSLMVLNAGVHLRIFLHPMARPIS